MENMLFISTMEYNSSIKNKDIMCFEDKWMELDNIIGSEVITDPKGHVWCLLTTKLILAKNIQNTQDTIDRTQEG